MRPTTPGRRRPATHIYRRLSHDPGFPQTTLWKLIKDIRFGMLTHRSATGQLHAHPLTTQNKDIDEQSELYFIPTTASSRSA